MGWLEDSINQQRDYLIALLQEPMGELAQLCMTQWEDRESLDRALTAYLQNRPEHRCRLLYAIDLSGSTLWMELPRAGAPPALQAGDPVVVGLDPARVRILEG